MRTVNSNLAVFLWTFRRKWKGYLIFIAANALLIFVIIGLYPEFSDIQVKVMAEMLGGDMEVSLTQNSSTGGDYTLGWGEYEGADGYVVVESDSEIPLHLTKSMEVSSVNLPLLSTLLSGAGKLSLHTFDAATTETKLTGLDEKYGKENALVYFGVLAFSGKPSDAVIQGTSETVNTEDMVSTGPFDKLMENPLIKSLVGTENLDIYNIKGFLCLELFNGLTFYIIIYFLIQYAGAFSTETENRTLDLILSTPLSRQRLFTIRYLSWVAMDLILIVCWIVFISMGVRVIGEDADVTIADAARIMISFLPFMLCVQGFCMLASVITNQSRKAYAVSLGIYFGMFIPKIVAAMSERFDFVKHFTIFHYWDHHTIFVDGIVAWGNVVVLTVLAIGLFVAGIAVFERKDLAA